MHKQDPKSEKFKTYCELLLDQALMLEGMLPKNPSDFAKKVSDLMVQAGTPERDTINKKPTKKDSQLTKSTQNGITIKENNKIKEQKIDEIKEVEAEIV
ncbi:unnamed protein product, partial [marine sediment metagenome]